MVEREGQLQPGATEVFRNLSMNSISRTYAVRVVNAGSELITLEQRDPSSTTPATSVSGRVTQARLDPLVTPPPGMARGRLAYSLNRRGPAPRARSAAPRARPRRRRAATQPCGRRSRTAPGRRRGQARLHPRGRGR
jgi:hypothetical protein